MNLYLSNSNRQAYTTGAYLPSRRLTIGQAQIPYSHHHTEIQELRRELTSHLEESKKLLYELKGMIASTISGDKPAQSKQAFNVFMDAILIGTGTALAGLLIKSIFESKKK